MNQAMRINVRIKQINDEDIIIYYPSLDLFG